MLESKKVEGIQLSFHSSHQDLPKHQDLGGLINDYLDNDFLFKAKHGFVANTE